MFYLRSCFDKPGMGSLRNEFRASHREYLKPFVEEGRTVRIVTAGPMCISDTDDTNIGSFTILEAPSIEEVEVFHKNDPFTLRDIFGRVEIVRWDRHIG
jgi:uncharacterized protein YciI